MLMIEPDTLLAIRFAMEHLAKANMFLEAAEAVLPEYLTIDLDDIEDLVFELGSPAEAMSKFSDAEILAHLEKRGVFEIEDGDIPQKYRKDEYGIN